LLPDLLARPFVATLVETDVWRGSGVLGHTSPAPFNERRVLL
jgi:hypothetical protein